jgi:hypothetical protein
MKSRSEIREAIDRIEANYTLAQHDTLRSLKRSLEALDAEEDRQKSEGAKRREKPVGRSK